VYAEERQRAITEVMAARGRASVQELAQELDVTNATVRRDLSELESRGLLRRTHGGAVRTERTSYLTPVTNRAGQFDEEKVAIAQTAVLSLTDHSTIGIDAGTTTIKLAEAIPHDRRLTVVTYSLLVATTLASHPRVRIHFLGGEILENSRATIGPWALDMAGRVTLDAMYVSVDGIDVEFGLTTHNVHEAAVKEALMRSARRSIVVADHSKFGRAEFGRIAPLDRADEIITDPQITAAQVAEVSARGVEVRIAGGTQ